MQVNLRENEIAKAVEQYLNRHGLKTRGLEVTVQFSMGKGANGLRAEINIEGQDQQCEIPGFMAHDREVDIPLHVLSTVIAEDPIRPGTLGATLKHHTETVQAHNERQDVETTVTVNNAEPQAPEVAEEVVIEPTDPDTPPWAGDEPEFEVLAVVEAGEPEITDAADDVGVEVVQNGDQQLAAEHPSEEVEAADTRNDDELLASIGNDEGVMEPVVEAEPEPVVEAAPVEAAKPVRKPIFGVKKVEAAPEPAPVEADPVVEEAPVEVPAAAVASKIGPVRRTASLFKKPAP